MSNDDSKYTPSDKFYIVDTGMKLECLAFVLGLSISTVKSYSSGRLKIPEPIKKKLILIAEFHILIRDKI